MRHLLFLILSIISYTFSNGNFKKAIREYSFPCANIFGIIIVSYSQIRLEELSWQEIHQQKIHQIV